MKWKVVLIFEGETSTIAQFNDRLDAEIFKRAKELATRNLSHVLAWEVRE